MKKKLKESRSGKIKKFIVGGTIVATLASSGFFLLKNKNTTSFSVPAYRALRVIDGDTFETAEHIVIRLAALDAPELTMCGGKEAKAALEKKILNKDIYLKIVSYDPYGRQGAHIYTHEGHINDQLIREGYALYHKRDSSQISSLLDASEIAQKDKRGIRGYPCTQTENKEHPACQIKGNINPAKIYYTPTCYQYKNTLVELHKGDRWFCTESEAKQAGFSKAKQCL